MKQFAITEAAATMREVSSQVRRAPKSVHVAQAFGKPDAYAVCMACWVDYMRTDDRDLGANGMKLAGEDRGEQDVHDRQRAADLKLGEAVNAMVHSLEIEGQWAVYKSQGIASAWRFPNADYATVLLDARSELEKKLRKNIATRIYFI